MAESSAKVTLQPTVNRPLKSRGRGRRFAERLEGLEGIFSQTPRARVSTNAVSFFTLDASFFPENDQDIAGRSKDVNK